MAGLMLPARCALVCLCWLGARNTPIHLHLHLHLLVGTYTPLQQTELRLLPVPCPRQDTDDVQHIFAAPSPAGALHCLFGNLDRPRSPLTPLGLLANDAYLIGTALHYLLGSSSPSAKSHDAPLARSACGLRCHPFGALGCWIGAKLWQRYWLYEARSLGYRIATTAGLRAEHFPLLSILLTGPVGGRPVCKQRCRVCTGDAALV